MSFRRLLPELSAESAQECFRRWSFFERFRRPGERLECLHLPYYVFEVEVEDRQRDAVYPLDVGVDALDGVVARFDAALAIRERSAVEGATAVSWPQFMDESTARQKLEIEFPTLILQVALKHNQSFRSDSSRLVDRVGYPFWVEYRRRRGSWDFRGLDALSGQRVGARTKALLARLMLAGP